MLSSCSYPLSILKRRSQFDVQGISLNAWWEAHSERVITVLGYRTLVIYIYINIYIWSILTNMVQIQKIKVFALYLCTAICFLCLWYCADVARKELQMEPYFYMPVLNIIDFRGQKLRFLIII